MGSTLMRSAVRKFLATEDPSLSPIPSLAVPSTPAQPVVASITSSSLALPALDTPTSKSPLSSDKPLGSTFTLESPVSSSIAPPAFNFGSSVTVSSSSNISKTSVSCATIVATTTSTSTSTPNFILSSTSQGSTSTPDPLKKTDSLKSLSFDHGKLENSFHVPTANSDVKKDQEQKVEGTQSQNVSEKPASLSNSSVNVTESEAVKPSFSFGLSTSVTPTPTTNTNSSFTFGGTTTDSGLSKLLSPSSFGLTNDKTSSINDQPKSLFGSLSSTKPSETTKLATEISNNVKTTSSFQFGSASDAQKTEKLDNKQIGLFSFGATNSASSNSLDNKAFTFGASSSTPNEVNKSTQLAKPVFQFGSTAPQTNSTQQTATQQAENKSGLSASVGSDLFGIKSPTLPKSSSVVKNANSGSIFGFSAIQPSTTSATPLVGSVSSTTTTSSSTFHFQQKKPEEKPASDNGGFSFKFNTNTTTSPQTTKPSFTFGATSSPAQSFGSSTGQPNAPGFGSSTAQSSVTGFGSSTAQTNPTGFGSSTAQANPTGFGSSTAQTNAPSFGSSTTQSNAPAFGSSTGQASASGFGSLTRQVNAPVFGTSSNSSVFGASSNQNNTSAFGGTTAQTNASPFGSSTVQSSTPAFGATTVQSSTPTFGGISAQASTTSFGASSAQPSVSAFGAPTASNSTNAFGSTSITPAFGNVTPAASLSFSSFSNTSAAPTFGTSTAAPAFGATSTTGFGSATTQSNPPAFAPIQPQQTQAPSFAFGAPAASNLSGGAFNFGTATQNQVQPPTSGVFQFGSSASTAQPFQFNAATPASNSQVSGGQPMFSIGSGNTAPRSRQLRRKK